MYYRVQASTLAGSIKAPPSKSHTLRAILFAALADGVSTIYHYLPSPDTQAMIDACRLLGAKIQVTSEYLSIIGVAGKPKTPEQIIDAGNSGQVLRFVAAISALTSGYTVLTGDHSLRYNRPITPLLQALQALDCWAVSTLDNGFAPIIVKGPLTGGATFLCGQDSQPVSALLMASAFAPQPTVIHVSNPGEKPWVDLTLAWLDRLHIPYKRQGYQQYWLNGNAHYAGFDYHVPGDFSSVAFPLIAALITGSDITITNLDMSDTQGDKALIYALQEMGADISINTHCIHVKGGKPLRGKHLAINDYIDALPILAVLGCFTREMWLTEAGTARIKESDRLHVMTLNLKKMSADITEYPDSLQIKQSLLQPATLNSFDDHRIAMALTVAALATSGCSVIENTACVAKSYSHFVSDLQSLGANIEVL